MTPAPAALTALPAVVVALVAVGYVYLGRYRPPRPPVGVFRWSDIAFMVVSIVLAPFIYLALPRIAVALVFGLVVGFAVQMTVAAVGGARAGFVVAGLLVATTAAAAIAQIPAMVTIGTDITLFIALTGVTNLWVQSGMKAVHVAALAACLTGYDLIATGLTSVMTRFAQQLHGLPFAPVLALSGGPAPVAIGLGDLLMIALYPLAVVRSYGRRAGVVAAAIGVGVVGAVDLGFGLGLIDTGVPLLTVLGPLIVAQQVYWHHRHPRERTVQQWLGGVAAGDGRVNPPAAVVDALRLPASPVDSPGTWVAVHGGQIVGSAATAGQARRNARERGLTAVPVVRQV